MVRKHYWQTKERARYRRWRPKTPAPKHGWLLAELAELAQTPASTVRYYVQQRLLRPIERRGTATRYERREFLRLLAFLRLKSDDTLTLAEKKRKLEAMGDEKIEQWLRSGPLPEKAAQALGLDATMGTPATALQARDVIIDTAHVVLERWQRITLLPGLDLMLNEDAKQAARITAQRIIAEYVG
jgi:DNA-binding transcriptional MerR regulator